MNRGEPPVDDRPSPASGKEIATTSVRRTFDGQESSEESRQESGAQEGR